MHRALERQFGASNVDIDSIAGWVRFTLPQAQKFDFNQMFNTFDGANYKIYTIEVVVKAKYEASSSGPSVVLAGTGQTFPFEGAKQWSGTQRIHAMAVGWKQFAPKLVWIKPSVVGAN